MKKIVLCLFTAMLLALGASNISHANNSPRVIQLNPNFGKPLRLPENAATIAIGDPNVADIVTVEPDLLMITGQRNGSTSMTVIGRSGDIYQYTLLVSNDVTQLKTLIHSVAPNVVVQSIKGRILLKGTVKTPAQLTRVLTIADRYMGGNGSTPSFRVISDKGGVLAGNLPETQQQTVVPLSVQSGGGGMNNNNRRNGNGSNNRLSSTGKANLAQNISRASVLAVAGGKVISMIEVLNLAKVEIQMRIVEVDRSKTDEFGIDWRLDGNNVTIGSLAGGVVGVLDSPAQNTDGNGSINAGASDLVGLFRPGSYTLSTFVRAMEEKGATTTLSEPLLTAISGEASQFMVGGTVPIPFQTQSSSNNTVATATNVRFMNFGLAISVRPTVLENGKINIVLDQSMSSLDYANAIQILDTQVPGFNQKTISTVTESESGETWAVAGLLTEEDRKNLQSVPWISKVPLLGEIFKNKNDSVSRNELIILVNARTVNEPNSTTTNFKGRGNLEPPSTHSSYQQSNELNSDIPYSTQDSQELNNSTEKNIRSIEIIRDKPIESGGHSFKENNDEIPAYKPYKSKKTDHALIDRDSLELNSEIKQFNKVAILHLTAKKNRQHVARIKLEDYKPTQNNIDYHADFKTSTIEQDKIAIKEVTNPQTQADTTVDTNKIVTAVGEKLSADKAKIESLHKLSYSNVKGVQIQVDDTNKQQAVIHNFLVGDERLAYLTKVRTQFTGYKDSDFRNFRVASGSYTDAPDKEVIFFVNSNSKNKMYSGKIVTLKPTDHKEYLVAIEY